jgi:hypothetical protein
MRSKRHNEKAWSCVSSVPEIMEFQFSSVSEHKEAPNFNLVISGGRISPGWMIQVMSAFLVFSDVNVKLRVPQLLTHLHFQPQPREH